MKRSRMRTLVGAAVVVALIAGCSSTGAGPSTGAASGGTGAATIQYAGGTFTLSPRIAEKIQKKEPLNFVNSYPYITIAGASAQMQAGAEQAAADIEKKYGVKVNTKVIGVPNPDAPTQIGQIQSGLNANQYDCLAVDPNPPGAFVDLIKKAMDQGVPVFTVNGDTEKSARIATSMTDDNPDAAAMANELQMGKIAGTYAIEWAEKNNQTFDGKKVALITGDATAPWAQGRLLGFVNTIKAKYPSVEIVGDPMNAYMVGFDTNVVLSKLQSFMTGHPDIFFYYSSDWGGVQIGQLIQRAGLQDKVFGLAFNLNAVYVQLLKDNLLIGTIDQRYDLQAKNWATMCADILFEHKAPPSEFAWVTPSIWNHDNIDDALALYAKIPNSGVTQ